MGGVVGHGVFTCGPVAGGAAVWDPPGVAGVSDESVSGASGLLCVDNVCPGGWGGGQRRQTTSPLVLPGKRRLRLHCKRRLGVWQRLRLNHTPYGSARSSLPHAAFDFAKKGHC